VAGLCDDAAIFPPGLAPLADAVPAHLRHLASEHADLVGPLILGAGVLGELEPLVDGLEPGSLGIAVTSPSPQALAAALAVAGRLPAVAVQAVEVAVPEGMDPQAALTEVASALRDRPDVTGYVEVPRDERRPEFIERLAGTPLRAKFRTGGVKAELYPDEAELAAAIVACVRAGVPFKATAGLHHAVRNTDPETGFEQHGFLNLMAAADAALGGADEASVARVLADRDGPALARGLGRLTPPRAEALRRQFISFGTCSITDPLDELTELGLIGA
jgi:hypothetical protein